MGMKPAKAAPRGEAASSYKKMPPLETPLAKTARDSKQIERSSSVRSAATCACQTRGRREGRGWREGRGVQ